MANTLTVGQQAPDFSLQDADGRTYSKEGLAGQRFILYFYPKAATPGRTTEACDFRDNLASLTAGGFAVLGVSPDSPEELQSFAADESLTFPPLSDPDSAVAKAYGDFGEKTIGDRTIEGTRVRPSSSTSRARSSSPSTTSPRRPCPSPPRDPRRLRLDA